MLDRGTNAVAWSERVFLDDNDRAATDIATLHVLYEHAADEID